MQTVLENNIMTNSLQLPLTSAVILKTIAYFDIFHYPIGREELRKFAGMAMSDEDLDLSLEALTQNKTIFLHKNFYSLHDNPLLACKRLNGNQRAAQLLPRAERIGRFLYRFPFVKGIAISGSLSKNFADEKADIDFFIITQSNRLWIARTLMHIYKKFTFLVGRQHFHCMNYYIDEQALQLEDQNIFTAIEIKTLLPVSGEKAMTQFFETNNWASEWLPVCEFRKQARQDPKGVVFKKIGEWFCNTLAGNRVDNYLMNLTTRRWKRKEEKGRRNRKGHTMGLITGKHFARSNPGSFQNKVLTSYKTKLEELGIEE